MIEAIVAVGGDVYIVHLQREGGRYITLLTALRKQLLCFGTFGAHSLLKSRKGPGGWKEARTPRSLSVKLRIGV